MKNKKFLIAIIIVLVLIAAVVAGILILKPFDKEDEDKEEKTNTSKVEENTTTDEEDEDEDEDVDYEEILKKFLAACKSEDDMNEFVENYVDIKSLYVADQVDNPSEFESAYKKAKAKDYEDFMDTAKEEFAQFLFDEDENVTFKKVKNTTKMSDAGIDMWTDVRFTVDIDGETATLSAIFCGDKIVIVSDEDSIDAIYDSVKEDDEKAENTVKNSTENKTNSTKNTTNKTSNSSSDDE